MTVDFDRDIVPALQVVEEAINALDDFTCTYVGITTHPRLMLDVRRDSTGETMEAFVEGLPPREAGPDEWMKYAKRLEGQFRNRSGDMWDEAALETGGEGPP